MLKQQPVPLSLRKLVSKIPTCLYMNSSIFRKEGPYLFGKDSNALWFKVYLVAIIGGLSLGYDTAIISGAIPYISILLNLEGWALGWAVSCILLGCALGSLIAGYLADKWGRRKMLIGCAVFFVATGIAAVVFQQLYAIRCARIIGGLGVGAVALLSPLYLSELAPSSLKGTLIASYQSAIGFGILLAYFSCNTLYDTGLDNWHWMLASQLLFSVLFFLLAYKLPETPGYLVKKGDRDTARGILVITMGSDVRANRELRALESSFMAIGPVYFTQLFKPPYRRLLLIGILVGVCQQLTGINVILYYAPLIFKEMGANAAAASRQTISIGLATVIAAVFMIYMADKMYRKSIMWVGSALMAFLLSILAVCFWNRYVFSSNHILILLLLYVGVFSCTLGTVTWLYLTEIFPSNIRGRAMSLAILALWLADFAVTFSFPEMKNYMGMPLTLFCYAIICGIFAVFMYHKIPETKDALVEEISFPGN